MGSIGQYHVNYLQSWGTPTIGGTEVGAIDLARSHMNHTEIGAMASAWMNDRAVRIAFTMNAKKIAEGFQGIEDKLSADNAGGQHDALIADCQDFVSRANDVHQKYRDYQRWETAVPNGRSTNNSCETLRPMQWTGFRAI